MLSKTLLNKYNYNIPFKKINYKSNQKLFFSTNNLSLNNKEKYKSLTIFQPDDEILKFYNKYLTTDNKSPDKEEYNKMYNTKLEYLNEKISMEGNKGKGFLNSSATIQKLTKFSGLLEYKHEMSDILKIITEKITHSDDKGLKETSEYYFKSSGKMIRPYLLMLIARYISDCLNTSKDKVDYFHTDIHNKYVKPFAACVEVLHNASLLQDDIIDNSAKRRNLQTAHNVFGIRNTVFGSNYIISRASNIITSLEIIHLNEVYSSMVYYLTYGECQQSLSKPNLENIHESLRVYLIKTYYKTASLIAMGMRGIGVIYGLDENLQRSLFNLGLHIGIVFQLIDDVMDVLYDSAKIQKPALIDMHEGVINSYVLFEIADEMKFADKKCMLELAKRKFKEEGDIEKSLRILNEGKGIIKPQNLAIDHLIECLKILENPFFIESENRKSLLNCLNYLISRNF
jgi:all-trans-nonaprenyl-diphosphate synthase